MRAPQRFRVWLLIVTVAVLFHLFLLMFVNPSYLSFLLPPSHAPGERSGGGPSTPDAILYVPLKFDEPEQEQTVTRLVEEPDAEETVAPTDEITPPSTGADDGLPRETGSGVTSGIGDIAGDASRPLPRGPEKDIVRIPPRPLQITWPDTRRLKHCLGHQIDVRVQVDEAGRIIRVEPAAASSPPECVRAAIQCAEQIVFAPGSINGHPAKMWTEIRIDFRKQNEP